MRRVNCRHYPLKLSLGGGAQRCATVGHQHVLKGRGARSHLNVQGRVLRLLATLEGRDSLFDGVEIRSHVAVSEQRLKTTFVEIG